MPRVIQHLALCKSYGTLVVPKWTSSCFWPFLWSSDNSRFNFFVKDVVEYVRPVSFFEVGSDKNSIFAAQPLTFNVLVLRLDFKC